jgi:hypothetical protein
MGSIVNVSDMNKRLYGVVFIIMIYVIVCRFLTFYNYKTSFLL